MAPLHLRLNRSRSALPSLSVLLVALAASCASAPTAPPDYSWVPDPYTAGAVHPEAQGVPIHAFTQGDEDADMVVLSLHGWAASGAEGLVFGEALLKEAARASQSQPEAGGSTATAISVRVVSPDLPGSGASGKPDVPYSPQWFVEVLDDIRESLGRDRVVVAGHSLGGRLALEYALKYPERTEALVLLAPAGLVDSFRPLDRWAMSRPGIVRAGSSLVSRKSYLHFYRRRVVHDPQYAYPEIVRWAMDGLLTPEGKRAFRAVTRNALAAPDLADRLPAIEVPVFLVWGKDDKVLKFDTSEVYAARLPDLRGFLVVDECSHLPQTERASETAEAVYAFLRTLRATGAAQNPAAAE